MKERYFETIMLIERLHYLSGDVVKAEIDRRRIFDISNVQCFILYNIGKDEMVVGEIANRGYYLGSNVSYNLKKLVKYGYIIQEKDIHDKRASKVRLSEKGLELYETLDKIFTHQAESLHREGLGEQNMADTLKSLRKLETFWTLVTNYGLPEKH